MSRSWYRVPRTCGTGHGAARPWLDTARPIFIGIVIGTGGIPSIWSCAADKLAEAEKLLTETTQK